MSISYHRFRACLCNAATCQLVAIAISVFSPSLFAQVPTTSATHQHLQPVPAYPDEYRQIVFKSLIKEARPEIWMLVRPSFSPEYAMVISEIPNKAPEAAKRYRIRWSIAERKIWRWTTIPGTNQKRLDPVKQPRLTEKTVDIPASAVDEMRKAWSYVINQVSYKDRSFGLDGTTYEFYVDYEQYGQTWSPTGGPPKMLVNLGEALIDFARADATSRQTKLDLCVEMARAILEDRDDGNELVLPRRFPN